jgi:hypothetical protein
MLVTLTQTLITAAVALLAAYRGALTRTSRLRGLIRADLELLDALPADHPSRPTLTTHVEELVDTLVRREARQFEPILPAGMSFGVHSALAVVMALALLLLGVEAIGLYHPDPPSTEYGWPILTFYGSLMVVFAGFAFRAWRRAHATR